MYTQHETLKHEWLCISKSQFIPSVCTFEAFSLALAANADMRSLHVHNRHLVVSSTSCPLLWTHAYRAINSLCGLTCLISACLMNSTVTFMYIRQIKQYGHSTEVENLVKINVIKLMIALFRYVSMHYITNRATWTVRSWTIRVASWKLRPYVTSK